MTPTTTRIRTLTVAMSTALTVTAAALPAAQASGAAFIEQLKLPAVTAGITQARLEQTGDDNQAAISQTGAAGAIGKGVQLGNGNTLRVTQHGSSQAALGVSLGDENRITISQSGDGAHNGAAALQVGTHNTADLTQNADAVTTGKANFALVKQLGHGNVVNGDQTATAGGVFLASNSVLITQKGDRNTAELRQNGKDNKAVQLQIGDDNHSRIVQDGEGNFAKHIQIGDDLNLNGGVGIEQRGDHKSVTVTQFRPGRWR